MNELQKQLFTLQDPSYLEFHSKLIPTIEKNRIIGIRTPALRSFAKDFKGTKEAKAFLKELPHHYYEENNLHMMLISAEKDYETCVREINRFLPYINNWATCDLPAPGVFKKHKSGTVWGSSKGFLPMTHTPFDTASEFCCGYIWTPISQRSIWHLLRKSARKNITSI